MLRAILDNGSATGSIRSDVDIDLTITMFMSQLLHRHLFNTKSLNTTDIETTVDSFLSGAAQT